MNVELIQATSLEGIIAGYRECHASQDKSDKGGEKDIALIKRLLFDFNPPHESPIEHALYTWRITGVSRALSHQLVRHRIASYSQRSQRYVSEKQFEYVTPPSLDSKDFEVKEMYKDCMQRIQSYYTALVEAGVPREDARMVLPNACTTSLVVSMNPRAFKNFLRLRMDKHAQWEIRFLATLMLMAIPNEHKFMYEGFINDRRQDTNS